MTATDRLPSAAADEDDLILGAPLPVLTSVRPAPSTGPLCLEIGWPDGRRQPVRLDGLFAPASRWRVLEDPALFARVMLTEGGAGVIWPGSGAAAGAPWDFDLSAGTLKILADTQAPFTGADFADFMARHDLSIAEAADVFDVVPSTVKLWNIRATLPGVVALAARAMDAEPLLLQALLRPRAAGRPRKAG